MQKYNDIPVDDLTHDQLLEIVRELRSDQNPPTSQQVPNEPPQQQKLEPTTQQEGKKKKKKEKKAFDWSKATKRNIALKIAYIGFNYQGFAAQLHNSNTVEAQIFKALKHTKIIEDETKCNYSRCGRTDKGVSALCQVIGIQARSNLSPSELANNEHSIFNQVSEREAKREIDYVKMMNNVLPDDIRCLSWAPVGSEFDARFGCIYRTYKYFFVKENLNVEAMRKAASYFVGYHDFRNFCKINTTSVKTFHRKILSVDVVQSDLFHNNFSVEDDKYTVYELIVCGYSFLWHQIRCMVSILFHVGRGEESPEIIKELLDVEKHPRKPQYVIASEYPLVLFDCVFEDVKWVQCGGKFETQNEIAIHYFNLWKDNVIKTSVIDVMLSHVLHSLVNVNTTHSATGGKKKKNKKSETQENSEKTGIDSIVSYDSTDTLKLMSLNEFIRATGLEARQKKYIPLMQRPTGTSYEEKLEALNNKLKQPTSSTEDMIDDDY